MIFSETKTDSPRRTAISRPGSSRPRTSRTGIILVVLVALFAGCTRGATGIFADIEQEELIKKSNLVDNTFVASVVKEDTGSGARYFAVAGTKLFTRSVAGGNWSSAGNPGGRTGAQYVAAVNGTDVYGVFARSEGDQGALLFKLNASGGWEPLTFPADAPATDVTGLAAIDTNGDGDLDRLLATVAADSGKRYLVVDPQTGTRTFHEFRSAEEESFGDDLGANRPVGKALVAEGHLWVARNGLWFLPTADLNDADAPLKRVQTPKNVGSFTYVDDGTGEKFLALVTLDGGFYRSPSIEGVTAPQIEAWAADWTALGSISRALSDVLYIPGIGDGERGRFLVSTITWSNKSSRGYFHADPSEGFDAVTFTEPGGNYRSTELRFSGISRMELILDSDGGSGGTVFALSESKGLWATPSYLSGEYNDPDWRWE